MQVSTHQRGNSSGLKAAGRPAMQPTGSAARHMLRRCLSTAPKATANTARSFADASEPSSSDTGRASSGSTSSSSDSPLKRDFLLTLERSVTGGPEADAALRATGVFGAEVHPNLPIATSWRGMYSTLMGRHKQAPQQPRRRDRLGRGVWRVETLGAQLRNREELRTLLCAACGWDTEGRPLAAATAGEAGNAEGDAAAGSADALLLVSGSHPVRILPLVDRLLPANSLYLLRTAGQLKASGVLPAATSLWAVANPVTERDASRLEQKVEAGAEVILTQPPLDWANFERWAADADRRGLLTSARVVLGAPMLASSGSVAFWLGLCGGLGNAAGQQLLNDFRQQEAKGPVAFKEWCREWNVRQLEQVRQIRGIRGLHVMPISAASKRLALDLIAKGVLGGPQGAPSERPPHVQ